MQASIYAHPMQNSIPSRPTAVAHLGNGVTMIRFQRGFSNFRAVKALIPDAEYCAPWFDSYGDEYLEVAIPSDKARAMGFDEFGGRFSLLLPQ